MAAHEQLERATDDVILGVDPGLEITGYAVLEPGPRVREAGVIRGSEGARLGLEERLRNLYDGLEEVMELFHPQVMVVEQLYSHYNHPRTAILMAHARGVLFLAAGQRGIPVISYNATQIKKTVTGNGRAPKDQVQRTIQRELGLVKLPEPPDVADALAAALCHYCTALGDRLSALGSKAASRRPNADSCPRKAASRGTP
jgi:crossover junction endodeoxyribonuclease RuvC